MLQSNPQKLLVSSQVKLALFDDGSVVLEGVDGAAILISASMISELASRLESLSARALQLQAPVVAAGFRKIQ